MLKTRKILKESKKHYLWRNGHETDSWRFSRNRGSRPKRMGLASSKWWEQIPPAQNPAPRKASQNSEYKIKIFGGNKENLSPAELHEKKYWKKILQAEENDPNRNAKIQWKPGNVMKPWQVDGKSEYMCKYRSSIDCRTKLILSCVIFNVWIKISISFLKIKRLTTYNISRKTVSGENVGQGSVIIKKVRKANFIRLY